MLLHMETAKRLYQRQGDKLRFLVVGGFNTAFSYGLFALLLFLLGDPVRSLSDFELLSACPPGPALLPGGPVAESGHSLFHPTLLL